MRNNTMSNLRIVVLGAGKVGKSAVTVRFLTKRFIGEYNSNKDLLYKSSIKQEDALTDIEILDTSTKKGFTSIQQLMSYADEKRYQRRRNQNSTTLPADGQITWADAFVIVYSICDVCSFQRAKLLLETISKQRSSTYVPALLVANKTDLEHRRQVGVDEGHQMALEYGCQYYEVSAAEDYITISVAFQALLRETKTMQQHKPMLKRRRSSLVTVSKRLGAMFGKKDNELEKKRTSVDISSPKLTTT